MMRINKRGLGDYQDGSVKDLMHVNYCFQGSGRPVLLVHGMAASLYDWADLLPFLAGQGYKAYALDLLGHGESAKPEGSESYTMQALVDHFDGWVESLNLEEKPVLIGHSLGGWLSLHYAMDHPAKVEGLALIAPFFTDRQLSPLLRLARRQPRLGERALHRVPEWMINTALGWDPTATNFSAEARKQIASDYKRASPHIAYLVRETIDLTHGLNRIEAPSFVIWGERDATLHPESFPRLVNALPNSRGYSLPGCGHQPHIGQPDLVNGMILGFLESLGRYDKPENTPI